MSRYRGVIVAINTDGSVVAKDVDKTDILADLNRICEGHIETVPGFYQYRHEGVMRPCIAFCNTDGKGKGLTYNRLANGLWKAQHGTGGDFLVGNIAVVFGNEEFMRKL